MVYMRVYNELARCKTQGGLLMPLYGLKALLRYRGIPYRELAEILEITITTFSNKINEKKAANLTGAKLQKWQHT